MYFNKYSYFYNTYATALVLPFFISPTSGPVLCKYYLVLFPHTRATVFCLFILCHVWSNSCAPIDEERLGGGRDCVCYGSCSAVNSAL